MVNIGSNGILYSECFAKSVIFDHNFIFVQSCRRSRFETSIYFMLDSNRLLVYLSAYEPNCIPHDLFPFLTHKKCFFDASLQQGIEVDWLHPKFFIAWKSNEPHIKWPKCDIIKVNKPLLVTCFPCHTFGLYYLAGYQIRLVFFGWNGCYSATDSYLEQNIPK